MSFKYLALCCLVTLEIVDVHGDDCADVTKSCLLTAQKQTNSTERCTVGQAYYDCLGNALPAAQAAGVCGATGILKHRFYALVDLLYSLPGAIVVDVKGCGIQRPAYFTLTPCERNMLPCVLQPLQDFRVSSNQTLSEESCRSSLTNFEVCMETQTPQCQDRDLVAEVIRKVKEEYSQQLNCNATSINSVTTDSSPQPTTTVDVTLIIAVTVASVVVVVIAVLVIVICRWKCWHPRNRGLENTHRISAHSSIYDDAASVASSVYDKIGSVYDKIASSSSAGTSDWSTAGLGTLNNPSLMSSDPYSGGQVSRHRESFLGPANLSSTSDTNTESRGTGASTTTTSHSHHNLRTSIANPSARSSNNSGASLPSAAPLYHLLLGNASSVSDTSSFASPRDSSSTVYASPSEGSTTYETPRDSSSAYASLEDESSSSTWSSGSGSWSSGTSSVVTLLRGPTPSTGSDGTTHDVTVYLANPSDVSSISAAGDGSGGSYNSSSELLP